MSLYNIKPVIYTLLALRKGKTGFRGLKLKYEKEKDRVRILINGI